MSEIEKNIRTANYFLIKLIKILSQQPDILYCPNTMTYNTFTHMRGIIICLILLGIANAHKDNQKNTDAIDVIVLDNTNLQQTIYTSEDPWLLDLYAPWCGHCMKMTADWEMLATRLKGSVKVAKIDASKYPQFNSLYGLKGFPHIVLLPAGPKSKQLFYTHSGPRTVDAFQKWTLEKISQHKRSLLERLTDEQKWNQVCIGPHSDFCVIFFLPRVTESFPDQQRDFFLKIIGGVIKKFTREPVSFLWAEAGNHQVLEDKLSINEQLLSVALINPTTKRYSIMSKQFTEDDFEHWLKNILDIEFKQYDGQLTFGNEKQDNEQREENAANEL